MSIILSKKTGVRGLIALFSFLILFLGMTNFALADAITRGANLITIKDKVGNDIDLYKNSYALVIGVSDYTNGWPVLKGIKKDVVKITDALREKGFFVIVVENPTQFQLIQAMRQFINQYGLDLNNRLLFYYAGHGYTLKQSYGENMGYIIPVDAPLPDKDISRFLAEAIDMHQIEVFAKRIQSKHALFIFDSCFAGSIFSLHRSVPASISYKIAEPVRQFITSGSAEEEVPDQSIFLELFIDGLDGEGDLNQDGYITGTELGIYLQESVINYTRGSQHPQFGKIRHPALSKGDFVFVVENGAQTFAPGRQPLSEHEEWSQKFRKKEKPRKVVIPLPSF